MGMHTVGLDALLMDIDNEAERVERNGDAAVLAGAAVVATQMAIEAPKRTTGLAKSITVSEVKRNARGDRYAEVGPEGTNSRGERYETIGYTLEYGRSDTPPNPFMTRAIKKSKLGVSNAMIAELAKD